MRVDGGRQQLHRVLDGGQRYFLPPDVVFGLVDEFPCQNARGVLVPLEEWRQYVCQPLTLIGVTDPGSRQGRRAREEHEVVRQIELVGQRKRGVEVSIYGWVEPARGARCVAFDLRRVALKSPPPNGVNAGCFEATKPFRQCGIHGDRLYPGFVTTAEVTAPVEPRDIDTGKVA